MTRVCTTSDTFPSSPTYQTKINNICSGLEDETARLNDVRNNNKKGNVATIQDKVKARCGTDADGFQPADVSDARFPEVYSSSR